MGFGDTIPLWGVNSGAFNSITGGADNSITAIKAYLTTEGMTQQDLAFKLKVSKPNIGRWIHGGIDVIRPSHWAGLVANASVAILDSSYPN